MPNELRVPQCMTAMTAILLLLDVLPVAAGWEAAQQRFSDMEPFPDLESTALRTSEVREFVSRTLGSHMVLQSAPQQAVVFGFTSPGASVTTLFNGTALIATAEPDGTWRQLLPAVSASTAAFQLNISSTSGETASLEDVVFGEARCAPEHD